MIFHILVVDDEPPVVDAIVTTLRERLPHSTDIYSAYRGSQALDIIDSVRIDLLITDIKMPDMSGLQLLDIIRKRWPAYRCIVMTGYSSFDYAREAIRLRAAAYILKSDSDQYLVDTVSDILSELEKELTNPVLTNPSLQLPAHIAAYDFLFKEALTTPHTNMLHPLLPKLGFTEEYPHYVVVLALFSCCHQPESITQLQYLFSHYVHEAVRSTPIHIPSPQTVLWLLQFKESPSRTDLDGALELLQEANIPNGPLSFLLSPFHVAEENLDHVCRRLMRHFHNLRQTVGNMPFVLTLRSQMDDALAHNVFDYITKYVEEHKSEDVTINHLSAATGYNGDYLSRLFRQMTGHSLGRYLINRRFVFIKELMVDESLSMQDIISISNFTSRSYFNRFIKRESGMTPHELRDDIIARKTQQA